MKAKLCRLMKRIAATFMATGIAVGGPSGLNALADTTTDVKVPETGQLEQQVEAYFNVTRDDLVAMGYDLIVTVPVSFQLNFDRDSRTYSGSAEVSASGVLDSGKAVSVTIDKAHEKYGRIYTGSGDGAKDVTKDVAGFAAAMSQEKWTSEMCFANMKDRMESSDVTRTGSLSAEVPFSIFTLESLGKYYTTVPLVIKLVDEA